MPKRFLRLIQAPLDGAGIGICSIATGKTKIYYAFKEIDCQIGGRAFALHKLGLGELYFVRIGTPEDCSCECLGFLAHGECKHLLGLQTLVERGLI